MLGSEYPREREDDVQRQINRMRDMEDDIEAFEAFIADKMDYFGDIFHNVVIDMKAHLQEEKWHYNSLKAGMKQ